MRHKRFESLVTLVVLLGASIALACPDCPTSRVVRASVLNGDFWRTLLTLTVPFLFMGVLSALLYRVGLHPPQGAPSSKGIQS